MAYRIDLESHVGRGTTFRVWFPLEKPPTRLLKPATREGAGDAQHEGGGAGKT